MGIENKDSGHNEIDALEASIFGTSEEKKEEETPIPAVVVDKKEETSKPPVTKTTVVTDEQLVMNNEMTKLDVRIEQLEKETVDTSTFYENIEEHLSEEEQGLEFSDKPAYMRLVNDKLKEFEGANSKTAEIQTLKDEKQEKQLAYDRQSAIIEVSAKYPDYSHENTLNYFQNDLSKAEQDKILGSSTSFADVFEKTYQKYLEINPANIEKSTTPGIPNLNNLRKETPNNTDIVDGTLSDDERLQEAIGF